MSKVKGASPIYREVHKKRSDKNDFDPECQKRIIHSKATNVISDFLIDGWLDGISKTQERIARGDLSRLQEAELDDWYSNYVDLCIDKGSIDGLKKDLFGALKTYTRYINYSFHQQALPRDEQERIHMLRKFTADFLDDAIPYRMSYE